MFTGKQRPLVSLHKHCYFLPPFLCFAVPPTPRNPPHSLQWRLHFLLSPGCFCVYVPATQHKTLSLPEQGAAFGVPVLDTDTPICLAARLEALGSCSLSPHRVGLRLQEQGDL